MGDLPVPRLERHLQWAPLPIGMRILQATLFIAGQFVRMAVCAVLVMFEPVLRAILVPLAFLSFLVTLIFGFLIADPRFPRWGMLTFSVGSLMLYWLYIGIMGLFMPLPPGHDHRH